MYGGRAGGGGGGGGAAPQYDTPITHYDSHGAPASLDVSPEINFEDAKQVEKNWTEHWIW